MPEIFFDAQDAVPEPFKQIATEKDGKFVINVVPSKDLDEFRNNNINLSRERDNLTSVLGRLKTDVGFDPEKIDDFVSGFGELREVKQQVDDGKLVKDTSLQQAVEAKTGEMKRTYEGQINGLKTENQNFKAENDNLRQELNRSHIDREVMTAINDPKSGALPEATPYILQAAYSIYTVGDNKQLVPKDRDGNVIYGADGASPMKPLEWLAKLQETSPFFFKSAQGGGSNGGGTQAGGLSPAQIAAMSPEEKMNYGRQHGMNR